MTFDAFMNQTLLLVQYTLMFASVLTLVALGGCFSEHSGVINIGLEGIMIFGALGGALAMRFMPADSAGILILITCVLAAMLAGLIYSLLLAVAAINFKADQTLVGTAMNLLGLAASVVLVKALNTADNPNNPSATIMYGNERKSLLIVDGMEFSWITVLTIILLVLSWFILYRTRFGLRLQACGEHPQAAASVGISVYKMRYAGVLISGALGGLGGLAYITASVSEWKFENGVAGFGFLALAVMIFGGWKPFRIALAAVLFGLFRSLSNVYSGYPFLESLNLPGNVYNMMPYVISLVVLILFSKNSAAPKSEGIPYDKGMR